jgi:hypothetical protein
VKGLQFIKIVIFVFSIIYTMFCNSDTDEIIIDPAIIFWPSQNIPLSPSQNHLAFAIVTSQAMLNPIITSRRRVPISITLITYRY